MIQMAVIAILGGVLGMISSIVVFIKFNQFNNAAQEQSKAVKNLHTRVEKIEEKFKD